MPVPNPTSRDPRLTVRADTADAARDLSQFFRWANDQSNQTAKTMSGALTGAVKDFSGALASAAVGTKSVSAAFSSMATSVVSRLVEMTAQALLFRLALLPFGGALGGALGFANGGRVEGFATGGLIRAGTGPRADDVLIRASRGEYVLNAAAVNYYGEHFLAALNQRLLNLRDLAGAIPQGVARPAGAFANGGPVGGGGGAVSVLPAPVNIAVVNSREELKAFMERHGNALAFAYAQKNKHKLGIPS